MSKERTMHDHARAIVAALAEGGINAPAMWREYICERTGMPLDEVNPALDWLVAVGIVKRVAPRQNDEWALTSAGLAASWLMDDHPPENPIITS